MDIFGSGREESAGRKGDITLCFGQWRGTARLSSCSAIIQILTVLQTKSVETTEAALQDGSDPSLPPLMNPSMLEASEDLTNLSHLNEPAGKLSSITTGTAFVDWSH